MEARLDICGEIGVDFTTLDLISFLNKNKNATSYTFVIDSEGGDFHEGFEIANLIENLPNSTAIAVKVLSIATVIYLACEKRVATPQSVFMTHAPYTLGKDLPDVPLNKTELSELSKYFAKLEKQLCDYYVKRAGIDVKTAETLVKKDNFFYGEEAQNFGFSNSFNQIKVVAMFQKLIDKLKAKNADDGAAGEKEKEAKAEMPQDDLAETIKTLVEEIADFKERLAKIESGMAETETALAEEMPAAIENAVKNALVAQTEALKVKSTNGAAQIPARATKTPEKNDAPDFLEAYSNLKNIKF